MTTKDPLSELKRFIAEHTFTDGSEATGLSLLDTALSAARTEVLEEARATLLKRKDAAKELGMLGRAQVFFDAADCVGALITTPVPASIPCDICGPRAHPGKACPVDVEMAQHAQDPGVPSIPVERVRAVLLSASAMLNRQGYGPGIIRDIARDLGVPLDAVQEEPEFCAMCNHEMFNHSAQHGGCVVAGNVPETGDRCMCVVTPATQNTRAQATHLRSGAQWAACGANGSIIRLSSDPTDVTCEDSRCKVSP